MTAEREIVIDIPDDQVRLGGTLTARDDDLGLVIFAHGSGSSRHSPRNKAVAQWLNHRGCATLLFDLLTDREGQDRTNVFDIDLLARRMVHATHWASAQSAVNDLPVAYFGASTGAAAALVAAGRERSVTAVVSRGGRPDLAGGALPVVTAPTLLIVGELDHAVLDLNCQAQQQMTCTTHLEVIPGATHLFEEPGTLEEAARHAGDWFVRHFTSSRSNRRRQRAGTPMPGSQGSLHDDSKGNGADHVP